MTAPVATPATIAAPVATSANATTPPATNGTSGTPAPEQLYELTIKGETKKYTRDEIQKFAGKSAFADNLMRQAKEALAQRAKEKEEREAEESGWKDESKWEEMLSKKGIDVDKLARRRLEKRVAEQEMTPEQRERDAAKAEADRLKKELEARDSEAKAKKQAETQRVIQQQMESQLAEAAEKAGLSKDADSFFAVYETVKEWVRLGLPWDPARIVETAKENIDGGFRRLEQSVLKGLKGQALEDRLGKSIVDELIRHRAEKLRNGGRPASTMNATPVPKKAEAPAWVSPSELQEKYRGGR